jgi:hypothetical protein
MVLISSLYDALKVNTLPLQQLDQLPLLYFSRYNMVLDHKN